MKDGLLPNLFPEGERLGRYHTVDATLWYFHALDRYYEVTGDRDTLMGLYPILKSVMGTMSRVPVSGLEWIRGTVYYKPEQMGMRSRGWMRKSKSGS